MKGYQNRYPYDEIKKTWTRGSRQLCHYWTTRCPRCNPHLFFSPCIFPGDPIQCHELNSVCMLKMLNVIAPYLNFPWAPKIYLIKISLPSFGCLISIGELIWPILSYYLPFNSLHSFPAKHLFFCLFCFLNLKIRHCHLPSSLNPNHKNHSYWTLHWNLPGHKFQFWSVTLGQLFNLSVLQFPYL